MKELPCFAPEHERVPATHVVFDGDLAAALCDTCLAEWEEDFPVGTIVRLNAQSKTWRDLDPGDVIAMPPTSDPENGPTEFDLEPPDLELVDKVLKESDLHVYVTFRYDGRTEKRRSDGRVMVVAHESGYGSHR